MSVQIIQPFMNLQKERTFVEMALKEKENNLPHIGDINRWTPRVKRKRVPLSSSSSMNGTTPASVPQRGEITDPLFQLKGQRLNTQRILDEQLANMIAMNNEKREAIRKRAQDLAEQRRQQRKAYSTPLYTSTKERKHHMNRARIQSSRSHSSLPVSPIHRKEKIPSPKQVWQAEEGPKLQTIHEPKPEPAKREISITLMSPQPEEHIPEDVDDQTDKAIDKKVSFDDLENTKKEEELDSNESKLAEQRLIESLEKQRQQQLLEQQKLVAEQQRQENERKEKERLKEEERLRKLKEVQNLQKQPLSAKSQNQENYYENTMNAAAKKKKGKVAKSKSKSEKLDKVFRKPKKVEEEEKNTEEKLPITKPSEVEPIVIEEVKKPQSPAEETKETRKSVVEVVKKERRDLRKCEKKADEEKPTLPQPNITRKKRELWIFEADTHTEKHDKEKVTSTPSGILPSLLGTLNPELIEQEKRDRKEQQRRNTLSKLISGDKAAKKFRKPGQRDNSYSDELRRLELAEERRKKQMEMYEKLKNHKQQSVYGDLDDGSPRFEDYGFLSKYCIFNKGNIEMYRHAFDAYYKKVDDNGVGWLEGEDVMIALRGVNNRLTEAEEEYLYRVLELTGFRITHGADFKMFSVLAALSQKISALDHWMKNLIGHMDFKALEMKMFKCKTLWECNVDKETNSISIDQLCVELRAGGVSWEHEMEVREKLSHLHALDLLDFLTYVPLFIMIHESVVQNPLDDTRNK